jgi:hypothetical protein
MVGLEVRMIRMYQFINEHLARLSLLGELKKYKNVNDIGERPGVYLRPLRNNFPIES